MVDSEEMVDLEVTGDSEVPETDSPETILEVRADSTKAPHQTICKHLSEPDSAPVSEHSSVPRSEVPSVQVSVDSEEDSSDPRSLKEVSADKL